MKENQLGGLPTDLLITGHSETRIVTVNGKQLLPGASLAIVNHSPDGFACGYAGSGPAQLALAILLKYLSVEDARRCYQRFKSNVVAAWPQRHFALRIICKRK